MIYRNTSTNIFSEIIDYDAKTYSNIEYTTQEFTSQNLEYGIRTNVNYMTNELNYSILDSSLSEIEPINDLSYVSSTMSKSDMTFNNGEEPTIKIEFIRNNLPTTFSNYGVTLYFNGDYLPNNINVKYYNLNNEIIADYNLTVTSSEFICSNMSLIKNYHKILITFIDTKFPYSFVKLNNLGYKIIYNWGSDSANESSSLLNAKISEETNILSNTIPINTCEFTVYDDADFNILSSNGIYDYVKQNQKVSVKEIIRIYDGDELQHTYEIFMGDFYIQEWSSNAEHQLTFKCVDLLGVIGDSQFYLGKQYNPQNDNVESVIKDIMYCANVDSVDIQYTISDEIKNKPLKGFIPVCSCREALQQVLFCIGAVADCSRSNKIKIYKPDSLIKYNIRDNNNLEYEKIKMNDAISNVYIYAFSLYNDNSNVEIFSGHLTTGVYYFIINDLIKYSNTSPAITVGSTNANIITEDSEGNELKCLSYFGVNVKQDGNFTITADTYSIKKHLLVKRYNNKAKVKKEIKCQNNYLLNNFSYISYATDTADRILNYYSNQYTIDTEFILSQYYNENQNIYTAEQTGCFCIMKNKYGDRIVGNINKLEIDLTGGFIAKANLVCVEDIEYTYRNYLCSNFNNSEDEKSELYSGDNIGLI